METPYSAPSQRDRRCAGPRLAPDEWSHGTGLPTGHFASGTQSAQGLPTLRLPVAPEYTIATHSTWIASFDPNKPDTRRNVMTPIFPTNWGGRVVDAHAEPLRLCVAKLRKGDGELRSLLLVHVDLRRGNRSRRGKDGHQERRTQSCSRHRDTSSPKRTSGAAAVSR